MKKLTYEDYCDFFAKQCESCKGAKRIAYEGTWIACPCQYVAKAKWRFEQIQITPPSLKYKNWNDFRGLIGDENITGRLTHASLIEAKKKAMSYCFDEKQQLIVHTHVNDGQNMIIYGGSGSGKTLLAALVLKEIAYAPLKIRSALTFKYIKADEVINAARWDNTRQIDHVLLDELETLDFLVIDGLNLDSERSGHNFPADMTSLNCLFGNRIQNSLPTIVVCTDEFYNCAMNSVYEETVKKRWGSEFLSIFRDPKNVVIGLKKEGKKVAAG